jgi:hypothetical protein
VVSVTDLYGRILGFLDRATKDNLKKKRKIGLWSLSVLEVKSQASLPYPATTTPEW